MRDYVRIAYKELADLSPDELSANAKSASRSSSHLCRVLLSLGQSLCRSGMQNSELLDMVGAVWGTRVERQTEKGPEGRKRNSY